MALDPNLDLQLATAYVGGITLPVPAQIGYYARVDPTGINLEYVPLETATLIENATIANGVFVSGTRANPKKYKLRGAIVVSEIITIPSFVTIDAEGATFTTTMAPAVGLADDWNNCLFKCASVTVGASTHVIADAGSTGAYPGATRIAVAGVGTLSAGKWVRVFSYNIGSKPANYLTDEYAPVYRIYQIASVGSGLLNLTGVVTYWHANWVSDIDLVTPLPPEGSTVIEITLTEGVHWKGGRFDCSGGTIANAMTFDGVLNGSVSGVTFKGFSRAGVEFLRGSKNFALNDVGHEGEVNCAIYIQQSENFKITNFRSPSVAAATKHANGIPRALITMRRRAARIEISNAHFAWGTIGMQHWHVEGLMANNITVENMNGNNRPASIDGQLTNRCGIAIDGGQADTALHYLNGVDGIGAQDGAPFSFDVNISNVQIYRCLGDATNQCFIYFHDTIGQVMNNVVISNLGQGDGTGGLAIKPIIISDAPGSFLKNVHCTGTFGCIYTENGAMNNGTIDGVYYQATTGKGYGFGYLLDLNHGYAGGGQFTVRNVKITNGGSLWQFGTQFNDYSMQLENFQSDSMTQASDLLICVINSGLRPTMECQVMQLTGALGGTGNKFPIVQAVATAGAQAKCVASVSGSAIYFETGTNGGFGFVQILGTGKRSTVMCANTVGTGPAITQGDLMRHSAAGDGGLGIARGDNAVTFDKALGRVCGVIPGVGATGLVRLV